MLQKSDVLNRAGTAGSAVLRRGLAAVACVIGLWLVSPMLRAGHLEGYTANLKAIAIVADRGDLMGQDALMPIVTEFLYYSRVGVVLLLRAIDLVFGEVGDAGFRALVVCSFLLLCLASVAVARRWGGVSAWAALIAVMLTPGVTETAFFLNDNIISAGLAVAALAVASRWHSTLAYGIAGALLAFAVLCRTDAVLLAPMLGGIAWLSCTRLAALLARGVAALAGAALLFAAALPIAHATPLDSLMVARFFVPYFDHRTSFKVALWFLGAPALVLLLIGVAARLSRPVGRQHVKWLLVFLVYPGLVAVAGLLRLSMEVRYIYPLLTPVVAIHAGAGLELLAARIMRPGRGRAAAVATAALLALCMALPPFVQVRDGPRSAIGRLWTPLLWFRWQESQARSMQRIGQLVAAADAVPKLLVIASHFNDDFYLKLRLLEDGYQVHPVSDEFPSCHGGLSVYVKPGHVVAHIRTENQYGLTPLPPTEVRALQIQRGLQCPDVWNADQIYVTAFGSDVRAADLPLDPALFGVVTAQAGPPEALSASLAPDRSLLHHPFQTVPASSATPVDLRTGEFHAFRISRPELAALDDAAERIAAQTPLAYDDFLARYGARLHPAPH